MSRSIALALLLLGLDGTSALAMDLAITSTQTQTVEVNDNYFLSTGAKATIYRPETTVTLNAVGRTPTTTFTLDGDFGYFKYLGPGADGMATTDGTQGGVRVGILKSGKLPGDTSNVFASWRTQDTVSAQLADVGVAAGSGQTTTMTFGGGLSRQLGYRDTLSWNAVAISAEFTGQGASPYVSLDNLASWRHRVSPLTEITSFADFNWTWRDDQTQSETKFLRLMTGLRTSLTQRFDVTGNVGVGFINGSERNPAGAVVVYPTGTLPYPVFSGAGSAQGLLWDVLALYRLQSTMRVSFSAAQTISPDIYGNLSQRKTFGAVLSRDVNSRSNWALSGGYTNFTAPGSQWGSGSSYDYFTAGIAYNYRLAREWRSSIAYTFRQRNADTGPASSNGVMLTIAHDATLLPHLP